MKKKRKYVLTRGFVSGAVCATTHVQQAMKEKA